MALEYWIHMLHERGRRATSRLRGYRREGLPVCV